MTATVFKFWWRRRRRGFYLNIVNSHVCPFVNKDMVCVNVFVKVKRIYLIGHIPYTNKSKRVFCISLLVTHTYSTYSHMHFIRGVSVQGCVFVQPINYNHYVGQAVLLLMHRVSLRELSQLLSWSEINWPAFRSYSAVCHRCGNTVCQSCCEGYMLTH